MHAFVTASPARPPSPAADIAAPPPAAPARSAARSVGLRLRLAGPDEIRAWSHGEVTVPATLDGVTGAPVPGGLNDEAIFGALRAWGCGCPRRRPPAPRERACPGCGQPVGPGPGQRERFGHVELAAPCLHPWFARGVASPVALLLDCSAAQLAAVLAGAAVLVTRVDEGIRRLALDAIAGAGARRDGRPLAAVLARLAPGRVMSRRRARPPGSALAGAADGRPRGERRPERPGRPRPGGGARARGGHPGERAGRPSVAVAATPGPADRADPRRRPAGVAGADRAAGAAAGAASDAAPARRPGRRQRPQRPLRPRHPRQRPAAPPAGAARAPALVVAAAERAPPGGRATTCSPASGRRPGGAATVAPAAGRPGRGAGGQARPLPRGTCSASASTTPAAP